MQEWSRDLTSRRAVSSSHRAYSSSSYTSRTTTCCERPTPRGNAVLKEKSIWSSCSSSCPAGLKQLHVTVCQCSTGPHQHLVLKFWLFHLQTRREAGEGICEMQHRQAHTTEGHKHTHTKKALKFRDSFSFCCPHTKFLLNKNIREAFETYFGWSDQTCLNASHYQPSLCDLKYQRTNQRGQHAGSLGRNLSLAQRVSVCQFCSAPSPGMGSYLEAEGAPGWMLGRRSSGSPQQAISQALLLRSPAGSNASLDAKRPKAPKHGSTHVSDCASKRPHNRLLCSQQWLQRTKETYSQTQPSRSSASYKQTDIYRGDLQLQECLNHSANSL